MTHEIPLIQHTPVTSRFHVPRNILSNWRLRAIVLGGVVTAVALWAVLPSTVSSEPGLGADATALTTTSSTFDEFAALFQPRDAIPVAPTRSVVISSAPTEPDQATGSAVIEDPGSLNVDIAPGASDGSSDPATSGILHPTPSWANALSPESTLDGRPLAVGDIVTAYDNQGVLMGRAEVEVEGKYGLMALYMDDPSTPIDEGANPGETISFKVNGYPALVQGPHDPVWGSNGAIMMLNLAAVSQGAS